MMSCKDGFGTVGTGCTTRASLIAYFFFLGFGPLRGGFIAARISIPEELNGL